MRMTTREKDSKLIVNGTEILKTCFSVLYSNLVNTCLTLLQFFLIQRCLGLPSCCFLTVEEPKGLFLCLQVNELSFAPLPSPLKCPVLFSFASCYANEPIHSKCDKQNIILGHVPASKEEMPNLDSLWLITLMKTDVPYSLSSGIFHPQISYLFSPVELSQGIRFLRYPVFQTVASFKSEGARKMGSI